MPILGNPLAANFQALPSVVRFNGDNSDTTFALGRTISSVQEILVSVVCSFYNMNHRTHSSSSILSVSPSKVIKDTCLETVRYSWS